MNILIAGSELVVKNSHYMDEKSWLFMKAFERAGMSTDYISYKLVGKMRFLETDKHLKKIWHAVMNKRLVRYVRQTKPDILVICKGGPIEAETLLEIRRRTDTIILNVMNDNPLLMGNFNAIGPCHYYFVKDTYVLQCLRRVGLKNVYYLPQCADTNMRRPLELDINDMEIYSTDLLMMGSMYPYRLKLIEELTHFKPAIWGKGWSKAKNDDVLKCYRGRSLWGMDKTKAICGAHISLNPHHPLNDISGTQSRTFDIAACGAFQLCEHKTDIDELLKIGEEVICYKSIDELKKLIEYYLIHPDERKEISIAGHKRVLRDHTYDNRVREILGRVKT